MSNVQYITFQDLCRICLSAGGQQHVNVYSVEGRQRDLVTKITQCLDFLIDEKDNLPKSICLQCMHTVETAWELRSTCRKSQVTLSQCMGTPAPEKTTEVHNIGSSYQPVTSYGNTHDLLNSFLQAVSGVQTTTPTSQSYQFAVDNKQAQRHAVSEGTSTVTTNTTSDPKVAPPKSNKFSSLEEFLKMKPDIKLTPITKKQQQNQCNESQQQHQLQHQQQQMSQQNQIYQVQMQPQITLSGGTNLTEHTNAGNMSFTLNNAGNYTLMNNDQHGLVERDKKNSFNFVLSPTAMQSLNASASSAHTNIPQLQFQLQPAAVNGQQQQYQQIACVNLAPPNLSSQQTGGSTSTVISPSKCLVPVTFRDDTTDQQIVAHVDTKNFMPTLQVKLQPQLTTTPDGQTYMQLMPTTIPATLQLAPQAVVSHQLFQTPGGNTQMPSIQTQIMPPNQQLVFDQRQRLNTTNIALKPDPDGDSTPSDTFSSPITQKRKNSQKEDNLAQQPAQKPVIARQLIKQDRAHQGRSQPQQRAKKERIAAIIPAPVEMPSTSAKAQCIKPQELPAYIAGKQNLTISRITPGRNQQGLQQHQPKTKPSQQQDESLALPVSRKLQQPQHQRSEPKMSAKLPVESSEKPTTRPQRRSKQTLVVATIPNVPISATTSTGTATILSNVQITDDKGNVSENMEYKFKCSVCLRPFKKKELLTQHVKLHAGIRNFTCTEPDCGKAFNRKEHLMRHLVSHSGQKMFSCDVCDKRFSRKDNLHKHRRSHDADAKTSPYSCDICFKVYASQMNLEMHKRKHNSSAGTASTKNANAAAK